MTKEELAQAFGRVLAGEKVRCTAGTQEVGELRAVVVESNGTLTAWIAMGIEHGQAREVLVKGSASVALAA